MKYMVIEENTGAFYYFRRENKKILVWESRELFDVLDLKDCNKYFIGFLESKKFPRPKQGEKFNFLLKRGRYRVVVLSYVKKIIIRK